MIKGKSYNLLIVDDVIKEQFRIMEERTTSLLPAVRQVIAKALDVIDSADHWCKGHDAVNTNQKVVKNFSTSTGNPLERVELVDRPVDPRDPSANAFCSQGAVIRAIQLLCLHPRFTAFAPQGAEILNRTLRFVSDHIPQDYVDEAQTMKGLSEREARNIVRFNDDPSVTYEDVRLCFKNALHSLDD